MNEADVNKLLEAPPDPDAPEPYIQWLGQKVDTGPLDKLRFGAYIYLSDEDMIRENATEHGFDVDSQDFWDAIERNSAIIEANCLQILRESGLHVSDEGHNENARVASVWIDTEDEEKRLALLRAVINWSEGDWPTTTSGTMDYAFGAGTTQRIFRGTDDPASMIDVTIEFTGTDALVEWSKLNLNEGIEGNPDDPDVFLRSYVPRMLGRLLIEFNVIKPHFPDAPTNWYRENADGMDLFRYNRVGEMREIMRQMKEYNRVRKGGRGGGLEQVTYRYKVPNPEGHSIVKAWLQKIKCPPTVIKWAEETNAPIYFFVSVREFNAYMAMVYPQVKTESIDDPTADLLGKLKPEVVCPQCGNKAEIGYGPEKMWPHPGSTIDYSGDVPIARYLSREDEFDPAVSIHHFDVKHIYKCRQCGERFDGTQHTYRVESVEDPDDPEAFIKRFKPRWKLLSHLKNFHFYFTDETGRVAVADYSMQNQRDPGSSDDGLLLLNKSKPITTYRWQGERRWSIPVVQYYGGVGATPSDSSISATKPEWDDLWPKLEPLGFQLQVREADEEIDPAAYVNAVTGWMDPIIKGMTPDQSTGHEHQWYMKWRLGGAHFWIYVHVRRPMWMQVQVNDALYGRNYMQRTFEFRNQYRDADQKSLLKWYGRVYKLINDAVRHEREGPDIVEKLMRRIEAYYDDFKREYERILSGKSVAEAVLVMNDIPLPEALDDPEMQRYLDQVTPEQCLHCGNDLTKRHTVVRQYIGQNLLKHELSGHYEGSDGYFENDEQPSANLIAALPTCATFEDICQRCGTNTAQPVRHEESQDPDAPEANFQSYMASVDIDGIMDRLGFGKQYPSWKCADPNYCWYNRFSRGLRVSVIRKSDEEPQIFNVTFSKPKTASYNGQVLPDYQEVASFTAHVGDLETKLRQFLRTGKLKLREAEDPDDPQANVERFAQHVEKVEADALESAILMAINEFEVRVRNLGINQWKKADRLAAEIGDQFASMAGYQNGSDEYDYVVSAVNAHASTMFPSDPGDPQFEARAKTTILNDDWVRQALDIFVQDGDITQREADTYMLAYNPENVAQLNQILIEIDRNIIDDAKIAQLTAIAVNMIRHANQQYLATLQQMTKDVKVDEAEEDPEAYIKSMPVRVRAWAVGYHGHHQTDVNFDAAPYFEALAVERGGLEQMLALVKEGFHQSHVADEVAYWFRDTVLKDFFGANTEQGYECSMSEGDVKRWIEHNKPDWYPYLWPKDMAEAEMVPPEDDPGMVIAAHTQDLPADPESKPTINPHTFGAVETQLKALGFESSWVAGRSTVFDEPEVPNFWSKRYPGNVLFVKLNTETGEPVLGIRSRKMSIPVRLKIRSLAHVGAIVKDVDAAMQALPPRHDKDQEIAAVLDVLDHHRQWTHNMGEAVEDDPQRYVDELPPAKFVVFAPNLDAYVSKEGGWTDNIADAHRWDNEEEAKQYATVSNPSKPHQVIPVMEGVDDPEPFLKHMETDWRKILSKYGWKPRTHGEEDTFYCLTYPDRVWQQPLRIWAQHSWKEGPKFEYEHPDPDNPDLDAEDAAYEEWTRTHDEFAAIRDRSIDFPDYIAMQFGIESYRRIEVPLDKLDQFCSRFVKAAKGIVGTEHIDHDHPETSDLTTMLYNAGKQIARELQIPLRESVDEALPMPPEDEPTGEFIHTTFDVPTFLEKMGFERSGGYHEWFKVFRRGPTATDLMIEVKRRGQGGEANDADVLYDVALYHYPVHDNPKREWKQVLQDFGFTNTTLRAKVAKMEQGIKANNLRGMRNEALDELPVPPEDEPTDVIKQHEKGLLLPELEKLGFTARREKGAEWIYGDEIPRWWYKVYNEQTRHALYVYFWGGQTPEVQAGVYDAAAKKWFSAGNDDSRRAPAKSQAHLSAIVHDLDAAMQRMEPLNLPVAEQYETIQRILKHHRQWWDDTLDYLIRTQGGTIPGRMGPGRPA